MALDHIQNSHENNFIIFSYSLSNDCGHPLIRKVLVKCHQLILNHCDIVMCCIPGHVGIKGNGRADQAAKNSSDGPTHSHKIPYSDFKPHIWKYVFSLWQTQWDSRVLNKLHSIQPVLNVKSPCRATCRRDEVVLTKCRIGHTRLTHSHLMEKEPPPECINPCQCPMTVKHILLRRKVVYEPHVRSSVVHPNIRIKGYLMIHVGF